MEKVFANQGYVILYDGRFYYVYQIEDAEGEDWEEIGYFFCSPYLKECRYYTD